MRMKKNVLSWFGHVERVSAKRMAKKIYDGKVIGKRGTGRPRLTFENTVSNTGSTCMKRLMTVDESKEVCRDRSDKA